MARRNNRTTGQPNLRTSLLCLMHIGKPPPGQGGSVWIAVPPEWDSFQVDRLYMISGVDMNQRMRVIASVFPAKNRDIAILVTAQFSLAFAINFMHVFVPFYVQAISPLDEAATLGWTGPAVAACHHLGQGRNR